MTEKRCASRWSFSRIFLKAKQQHRLFEEVRFA